MNGFALITLFDPEDDIAGAGNFSASLYAAATKYVNENDWNKEMIIEVGDPDHRGLIGILEDKGYVAAVLP